MKLFKYFSLDDDNKLVVEDVYTLSNPSQFYEALPSKLDLNKKDRLYIYLECKVPRFKLKKVLEDHQCAVVRDLNKANKLIVNKESIYNLVRTCYYYHTTFIEFKDALSKTTSPLKQIFNNLFEHPEVYNIDKDSTFLISNPIAEDTKRYTPARYWSWQSVYEIDSPVSLAVVRSFINNPNVYQQKALTTYMNDSVLNSSNIKSLEAMFKSTSKEDWNLATEMLANYDYERSAVFILLTLSRYNTQIKESKSSSHVNFKAMLDYFGIKLYHFSNHHILGILKSRSLLTHDAAVILLNSIYAHQIQETQLVCATHVDFVDDIKKAIKTNIIEPIETTFYPEDPTDELNFKI
jgi:hypothetical protein